MSAFHSPQMHDFEYLFAVLGNYFPKVIQLLMALYKFALYCIVVLSTIWINYKQITYVMYNV